MKIITLTHGKSTVVDDDDFTLLNAYEWQARKDRNNYYAQRGKYIGIIDGKSKSTTVQMSRFILGISDSRIKVDHKNGDTLDNRKENLRVATVRKNNTNLHNLKSNNTSGYRGVVKRKDTKTNQWRARICLPDGTKKTLGQFPTAEDAAKAFDKAAKEMYGEFCGKLNFE